MNVNVCVFFSGSLHYATGQVWSSTVSGAWLPKWMVPHDLAVNRKGSINGGSPKCMVDKGNSYL